MRLFIAEKPSLGNAIAEGLGVVKKQHGFIECKNGDVVTWCIGHLLEQAEPEHYGEQYKIWSLDNLPILPNEWVLQPKEATADQLKVIVQLVAKADVLVNAGDPDREGVLLVNQVIEYAKASPEKIENALRVLINDLNPTAVTKALNSLEPNKNHVNMGNAALCRSRADWLLGMNMTRACTVMAKTQGYVHTYSVGRVQTPTLGLVVKRDLEIAHFNPIPFFDISANFSANGVAFKAKWQVPESLYEDKRCIDEAKAKEVCTGIKGKRAVVVQCETKRSKSQPPLLFSLRTLQEHLSSKHGFGAQKTLDLAQSLYEKHKLTSYPRTDMPYLPSDKRSEIDGILDHLSELEAPFDDWVKNADRTLSSPSWDDKKLIGAAHTAIIPTARPANLSALSEDERIAYTAIAARYIAQFYPHASDDNTLIELLVDKHTFKTRGKIEIEKGWRVVLKDEKNQSDDKADTDDSQSLPMIGQGEEIDCVDGELQSKKTTPPKEFTEGTLLTAMSTVAKEVTNPAYKAKLKETAGLGTEATRAGIIETLKERGFLEIKGKSIRSTSLGKMLILALPTSVKDPALTAIWEQQLDVIEKGEYSVEDFEAKMHVFVTKLIDDFKEGKSPFTLPPNSAPRCKQKGCGGWLNPYDSKGRTMWRCSHCEQRYKDNKGAPGNALIKIGKLEI